MSTVTLTGTYHTAPGGVCAGTVTFQLEQTETDGSTFFVGTPTTVTLDGAGSFSVVLTSTDGLSPAASYRVTERIRDAKQRVFWIQLAASPSSQNLAGLVGYTAPVGTATAVELIVDLVPIAQAAASSAQASQTAAASSASSASASASAAAASAAAAAAPTDATVAALVPNTATATGAALAILTDSVAYPQSDLSVTSVTSTVWPLQVGDDGFIYAVTAGSQQLIRSNDGFTTTDTGRNLALDGATGTIFSACKTSSGYYAVEARGGASGAKLWHSASWTSGWTIVQSIGNTVQLPISRPTPDPSNGNATVLLVGEYGLDSTTKSLWLSRDGGASWSSIKTIAANDGANNNHFHGSVFDTHTGRIYASHGDIDNAWFGYTPDFGTTWIDMPATGLAPPSSSIYHQPVLVGATSRYVFGSPDGGVADSGIVIIDKDTSHTGAVLSGEPVLDFHQYGQAPYAQDGDEVYAFHPMAAGYADSGKVYISATGDGGRSWHKVYEVASTDIVTDTSSGIVGPDATGQMYVSVLTSSTRYLWRVAKASWRKRTLGAQLLVGSDLMDALILAGLAQPGTNNLDLAGGTLKAATISGLSTVSGAPNFSGTPTVSGGTLTVGANAATPSLNLNGAASTNRSLLFQTGGSSRWILRANSTSESGSNAGSGLELVSRTDTGAALATVMQWARQGDVVVGPGGVGAKIGFYGATGAGLQTVTGSRGGNAALASLLTALASLGLITDSTTA